MKEVLKLSEEIRLLICSWLFTAIVWTAPEKTLDGINIIKAIGGLCRKLCIDQNYRKQREKI